MLLSIIIPIYNVENYLLECLNSIAFQIDNEVELILINDGSTDSSYQIASKFSIENPEINIKLVNKSNGGLSDARNVGINESQGEYLGFLDSDDILTKDYYRIVKDELVKDIDLLEFDTFRFIDSLNLNESDVLGITLYKDNINYFKSMSGVFKNSTWFVCTRIFRKSLFDNIQFPKGRHFEDVAITPILYLKSKNIISIKKGLLGYRINPNGITNNLKISDIDDLDFCLDNWFSWQKKFGNEDTKVLFGMSNLRLSVTARWINQLVNKNDLQLTKKIRRKIIKNTPIKSYLYSFKSILSLFFPKIIILLLERYGI